MTERISCPGCKACKIKAYLIAIHNANVDKFEHGMNLKVQLIILFSVGVLKEKYRASGVLGFHFTSNCKPLECLNICTACFQLSL